MNRSAVLVADSLSKRYSQKIAIENISFQISSGETVGVIGPNGAGKSTLMKIITGAAMPTSGSVSLNPGSGGGSPGRVLGFVLNPIGISPEFTATSYLRYEAKVQGIPRQDVEPTIDLFELREFQSRRFRRLSTGQKQRVGLAAASLSTPEILMLDEPTNGLDIESINWLRGLIHQRKERGLTTIVSSHNFDELGRIVERVLILQRTIRFDGLYSDAIAEGASLEDQYFKLTDRPVGAAAGPGGSMTGGTR